jgi:signal transduction histidine kinase
MNSAKRKKYHSLAIFILSAALICILCWVWLIEAAKVVTEESVNEMSRIYMQELSVQKTGLLDTILDSSFSQIETVSAAVSEDDLKTEEKLRDFLSRIQQSNGYNFIAFIDNNGNFHCSDDDCPILGKIKGAEELLTSDKRLILSNEDLLGENVLLLGESIPDIDFGDSGDCTLTAVLIGFDTDSLSSLLSLANQNVHSHAAVYTSTGQLIVNCNHSDGVSVGNNLFIGLDSYSEFASGYNSEMIREDFAKGSEGMTIFSINGQRTYLFYSPIADTDWYMTINVPYSAMESTVSYLSDSINTNALLLLTVVIIVLVIMFLIYYISMKRANLATDAAREKAEQASRAKSEFLSHMSHDIRTPINGIMGMTSIALKNTNDPERVEYCLKKIDGSSQHLLSLINDVLDMSRIESGKTVIACDPFRISEAIEKCSSIIYGQILNRDITLESDFGEFEHDAVLGDELHLRQILINILGNAVKFTPDGGKISFRVHEESVYDGEVRYRFEVRDTGIGMKPEFLDHIWDAFSQENSSIRTDYNGTGLGMAITKRFVDMMGGNIYVESAPGKGSNFTVDISFPIDKDAAVKAAEQSEKPDISGMKILLAEDNELNAEIASCILEEEGAEVVVAENGQIALDLFTKSVHGDFDAILMDVMMPVMDGCEATKAIRASEHPDAQVIPIIAMTANAYEEDIKKTADAGMNAHISKPINIEAMLKLLSGYYVR